MSEAIAPRGQAKEKPRKLKRHLFKLDGSPRYVRCYDDGGKSGDRYTAVFTGNYRHRQTGGVFIYLGMSAYPFHPQGIGMHGESEFTPIDRPAYAHLGKRIAFSTLPEDCRKFVMQEYCDIWETAELPAGQAGTGSGGTGNG